MGLSEMKNKISETSTLDEINIRLDTAKEEINLKI